MNIRGVLKLLEPLQRRVMLLVSRAVIRTIDDSTALQLLQAELLRGEVRGRLERFGALGLTAVPLPGAEGIVLFLGGNRDHGVVVATEDRRHRPKGLKAGETALYHAGGNGTIIRLLADGSIELKPSSGVVRLEGDIEVSGHVLAGGDIQADGEVRDLAATTGLSMEDMRERYNVHVHADPQGGATAPPLPLMTP